MSSVHKTFEATGEKMGKELQFKPRDRIRYVLASGLGYAALAAMVFTILEFLEDGAGKPVEILFWNFVSFIFISFVFFLIFYFGYPRYLRRIRDDEESRRRQQELDEMPFRCFKCEALIQRTEDRCPQCGWTWK